LRRCWLGSAKTTKAAKTTTTPKYLPKLTKISCVHSAAVKTTPPSKLGDHIVVVFCFLLQDRLILHKLLPAFSSASVLQFFYLDGIQ
jgi:hypothetical protein